MIKHSILGHSFNSVHFKLLLKSAGDRGKSAKHLD